ncbi:Peroxisomal hydratase-dehydrogenase-epimerase [Purpureocillium lavendulum]|uniref:catechol O-methyltransferase n=1 Tax=Purpureocillium lavendulum TaxID=1247861 RepID=A0AB34FT19_9HYPO|nr:Peroxisomal hydratase-dehydrogenase-epimerase [Purpureocillium lavendulum]
MGAFDQSQAYAPQEEVFFDDGREVELLHYVYNRPDIEQLRGSPAHVLRAIDEFGRTRKYLMNVGEAKGSIITKLIADVRPQTMVELGGYVGNPEFAAVTSSLINLAGLQSMVQVVVGASDDSLRRLHAQGHLTTIDLLFLDHYKPAYTPDLKLCEQLGLVRPGSVLAADNVIKPGNPPYLEYVRSTVESKRQGIKRGDEGGEFDENCTKQYEKREGVETLSHSLQGDPSLVYQSELINSFEPTGVPAGELIELGTKARAIQLREKDIEVLHSKTKFIDLARSLGLLVPDTRTVTDKASLLEFFATRGGLVLRPGGAQYLVKPAGVDDVARFGMPILPLDSAEQTLEQINSIPFGRDVEFVVQEFIHGEEYCTHALVVRGRVRAFVACPSSGVLMHYAALKSESPLNKKMLHFTETVVASGGDMWTGHVSFDFLVKPSGHSQQQSTEDIEIFPIECNPRVHTAVVLLVTTAMASSMPYDTDRGDEEHILDLPNDRRLAFAHNGPPTSRTVVLFFSGLMSVGTARDVPQPCRELGVHWIAPTLPGMGNSSARASGDSYYVALARDISALLDHLYPGGDFDALYVAGGSYGTVQAQMIFGAPYDVFPAGRKIVGCMLLAGFSPFKYHVEHAKSLNWQTWFSVGPPSQLVPFHLLQRLTSTVLASKFKTLDGAKDFLNQTLFARMEPDERATFAAWLEKKGRTEQKFIETLANGAVKCCKTWDGFIEVSDVIHSDWGFDPAKLDEEHASKPVLVVGSEQDHVGGSTNDWLVANYRNAKLKMIPGGHISALFYMDEIWQAMIDTPANTVGEQTHLEIFPIQGPPHGIYTGEPRPEVDNAWRELLKYNNIRVSDAWVHRWGREHEAVKLPDGGYLGMLSVFHELHCISLTPEYYFPNATEKELATNREHNRKNITFYMGTFGLTGVKNIA